MPKNFDMKGLNYTRDEFFMERAKLITYKKAEDSSVFLEKPDGKKFNRHMEKLEKYYKFGQYDFQKDVTTPGSSYIFMPEFAEHLAVLLLNLENNPNLKRGKNYKASEYMNYYKELLENAEKNFSLELGAF